MYLWKCNSRIPERLSFNFQCTKNIFLRSSLLETFIIKQRPNDSLTRTCTTGSAHNFMERVPIQTMRSSWTRMVSDLRFYRSAAKLFFKNRFLIIKISPSNYPGRKLRKLILRPIMLFSTNIRQLIQRIRNAA